MDIVKRLRSADPISQQRIAGSSILAEAADEIERLRADLKSCPCPGGGWNGMPKDIEPTIENCMAADACGCCYGTTLRAVERHDRTPFALVDELRAALREPEWQPITGEMKRKVLVTNNINARDASGSMSHVWIAGSVTQNGDRYCAFDNKGWNLIENLTHYAELPVALTLNSEA